MRITPIGLANSSQKEINQILSGLGIRPLSSKLVANRVRINQPYNDLINSLENKDSLNTLLQSIPESFTNTSTLNRQVLETFDNVERTIAHKVIRVLSQIEKDADIFSRKGYKFYRNFLLGEDFNLAQHRKKSPQDGFICEPLTGAESLRILFA